ncbi:MAG: transglycosylase domain-containing protein [Clostridia bacterium]|nr:transglycosylase domain-containing protein [Clostridia bacterium]
MDRLFRYMCFFMTVIIVISSFGLVIASAADSENGIDLFGANEISDNIKNLELDMTTIIYAKDNDGVWQEYKRIHGEENRIWVPISSMPQYLIDAFIAIEDERYYEHNGVDWKRTTGAFVNYLPFVELYSSQQGGSTITQQLIKNLTEDKDKSALRKVREIFRALLVEKQLSKTQIMEAYLNTISLGNGICGVQVAANYYFNKEVKDLTLNECAALAAITKNPSAYNPERHPKANKKRRNTVIMKMLQTGTIDEKEFFSAYDKDIVIDNSQELTLDEPINDYFTDTLIDEVIEDFTEKYNCSREIASTMIYNGGYKIYSTVNPTVQQSAETVYKDVNRYFYQNSRKNVGKHVESAITILDYEGHIVGIVGGTGEKTVNRGLNRAIDSPRQPGSTMKPLGVYAPAIDRGLIHYSSILTDEPLPHYYSDGRPGPAEWYGTYDGKMTVQMALERSVNTIPCWIIKDYLGIENSYDFLKNKLKLKYINNNDKDISSLALGGCNLGITTTESAAAYAIFGNGGKHYETTSYYRVEARGGEVVLEKNNEGVQVIKSETATIMNKLLQRVIYGERGTGNRIAGYNYSMKAYGKTGTTSDANDLWMVAGTPYYVASVWYGFDEPETIYNSSAAATVWRAVMSAAHRGLETKTFVDNENVLQYSYCAHTGLRPLETCESKLGYYLPGFTPAGKCDGVHFEQTPVADGVTPPAVVVTPPPADTEQTESAPDTESEGAESSEGDSKVESGTESDTEASDKNESASDNESGEDDNKNESEDTSGSSQEGTESNEVQNGS